MGKQKRKLEKLRKRADFLKTLLNECAAQEKRRHAAEVTREEKLRQEQEARRKQEEKKKKIDLQCVDSDPLFISDSAAPKNLSLSTKKLKKKRKKPIVHKDSIDLVPVEETIQIPAKIRSKIVKNETFKMIFDLEGTPKISMDEFLSLLKDLDMGVDIITVEEARFLRKNATDNIKCVGSSHQAYKQHATVIATILPVIIESGTFDQLRVNLVSGKNLECLNTKSQVWSVRVDKQYRITFKIEKKNPLIITEIKFSDHYKGVNFDSSSQAKEQGINIDEKVQTLSKETYLLPEQIQDARKMFLGYGLFPENFKK